MKLLYLFLLSMLFCTYVLGAQEASTPGDEPLRKPVTIAVKGEALSDIMAMLSKQTGLKLRAAKEIADQKATVFVDGRPLKDLLDGLCTIFGYRLSMVRQSDGSQVYEIWESSKTRLARRAVTVGAEIVAWRDMDRRIREIAASTPEEQERYQQEFRQLWAKHRDNGSLSAEEQARLTDISGRFGREVPLARLYAKLSPEAIRALQSGAHINFDTNTDEAEWRIPADINAAFIKAAYDTGGPPEGYNIQFQFSRSDSRVALTVRSAETGREGGLSSPGEMPIEDVSPEQRGTLPNADDDGTLAKQITFTARELADEADLYGQTEKDASVLVNRSDILALLHRKLGLQSISDHHSYWFTLDSLEPRTVKGLLDHLPDMIAEFARKGLWPGMPEMDPHSNPVWGWDGTRVYMRERFPYKLDVVEPPNRVIRRLRTNLAQNHYLDFDDVAEMATLTLGQYNTLGENWNRLVKVTGGD